jgi:hypothetical protein
MSPDDSSAARAPADSHASQPAGQKTTTDEFRRAPRKTIRSMAQIVCDASGQRLDCFVQDISASGAKLRLVAPARQPFAAPLRLPQSFRLVIPNDHIEIDGQLAWSREATLGVVFRSPFRPLRPGRRTTG